MSNPLLIGAAGLSVAGSTYQYVSRPNIAYFIGPGKVQDIARAMSRLQCTCVIFDIELSPSQQKNLEAAFNENAIKSRKLEDYIKVIDRSALILDIFAQHAKTREGQLQVELALLSYRLPRLTNMWSHLERQSSGARGRSNGGVGLRGPGEKQLESDRRQMRRQIVSLNKAVEAVRTHRSMHRRRRRQLGVPLVALVGYTNSGKSSLLNALSPGGSEAAGAFAADMLFATLDPTTRMVRRPLAPAAGEGASGCAALLLTDTVGFVQKLPPPLVAAFRATLEELHEADLLLHVVDVSSEAWRQQEASVLHELQALGLGHKPLLTLLNKIDKLPAQKEFFKRLASKRADAVAVSAASGEGLDSLGALLGARLGAALQPVRLYVHQRMAGRLTHAMYRLGAVDSLQHLPGSYVLVAARVPRLLLQQLQQLDRDGQAAGRGAGAGAGSSRLYAPEAAGNVFTSAESFGQEVFMPAVRLLSSQQQEQEQEQEQAGQEQAGQEQDWKALGRGRHSAAKRRGLRAEQVPLQKASA
jgi:GTP-binding protein HflX